MGRTGRAGAEGSALSFIAPRDYAKWDEIQVMLDPSLKQKNRGTKTKNSGKRVKSSHKTKSFRNKDDNFKQPFKKKSFRKDAVRNKSLKKSLIKNKPRKK